MEPSDQRGPPTIAELLNRALAASHEGAAEVARRYFELVLEQDPSNEQAWLGLARLSESRELAEAIYQRILEINPASEAARRSLEQLDDLRNRLVEATPPPVPEHCRQPVEEPERAMARGEASEAADAEDDDPGPRLFVPPWDTQTPVPIMPDPARDDSVAHDLVAHDDVALMGLDAPVAELAQEAGQPLTVVGDGRPSGESEEPKSDASAAGDAATALMGATQTSSGQGGDSGSHPASAQEVGAEDGAPADSSDGGAAADASGERALWADLLATADVAAGAELSARAASGGMRGAEATPAAGPGTARSEEDATLLEAFDDGNTRPKTWSRLHPMRDGAMLMMLGFVLMGSLLLVFLTGDVAHAQRLRVVLGVVTETPTPTATSTFTATASPTATYTPTATWTATSTPSRTASPTATSTPSPTATPDWYTSKYLPLPLDEKWIEVDLSEQALIAYDGTEEVFRTTISSGRANTPTLEGKFRIKRKLESQLMAGPGYYLPNVPWVMYFQAGFALHGAYWHDKWGTPTSHGCVNLRREDAKWLYDWTGPVVPEGATSALATADNPGTWVLVHK